MVSLASLWLPIVLAAVVVFVASSVIHMVLKYHNSEYKGLANEEEVRAAINRGGAGPGMYTVPYCTDMKDMAEPAMVAKFAEGPVALMILRKPGAITMGPMLGMWFVYTLLVSALAGYVAARVYPAGTDYMTIFCMTALVAFATYAGGCIPSGIWRGVPWSEVAKEMFDGVVFALLTGGVFGWLWPMM